MIEAPVEAGTFSRSLEILGAASDAAGGGSRARPRVAIVAGSGLGGLAGLLDVKASLAFDDIPALAPGADEPKVEGHALRWLVGLAGDVPVHLLLGRRHLYEGVPPATTTLSVRLLAALGVRLALLTNAAGGLSERLIPGDLMLIRDHINLTFRDPLRGRATEGARFPAHSGPYFVPPDRDREPDLRHVYDLAASAMLRQAALDQRIALQEGTYAAVPGPNYETRAEVEALRWAGADAVGMSTVPEALAARRAGLAVVGLSLITNSHVCRAGEPAGPTTHEEVLAVGRQSLENLTLVLKRVLPWWEAKAEFGIQEPESRRQNEFSPEASPETPIP